MCEIIIDNLLCEKNNKILLDLTGDRIQIDVNDHVAIIGANGAGKTTFINCLLDLIGYDGDIKLNFSLDDVGVVFQNNVYNDLLKVYELIELVTGLKKGNIKYIEFIKYFELEKIEKSYIKSLSGGEKQLLTISLVIYQNKTCYIFDELTTGLDFQKKKKINETIRKNIKGKTILQITHNFNDVDDWANKVLVLDKGKKLFYGTTGAFLEKFNHYAMIEVVDQDINKYYFVHDIEEYNEYTKKLKENNSCYSVKYKNIFTCYMKLMENRGVNVYD